MAKPIPQLVIPDEVATHPAWVRLEDQLAWYGRKSAHHEAVYKRMKRTQIVLATAIPLFAFVSPEIAFLPKEAGKWLSSAAGALIAILEGLQQLGQHSTLWTTYRATAEALKHEKYLLLAGAGPYRDRSHADRVLLLAERVEERVSTEHAKWLSETEKSVKQGERQSPRV